MPVEAPMPPEPTCSRATRGPMPARIPRVDALMRTPGMMRMLKPMGISLLSRPACPGTLRLREATRPPRTRRALHPRRPTGCGRPTLQSRAPSPRAICSRDGDRLLPPARHSTTFVEVERLGVPGRRAVCPANPGRPQAAGSFPASAVGEGFCQCSRRRGRQPTSEYS